MYIVLYAYAGVTVASTYIDVTAIALSPVPIIVSGATSLFLTTLTSLVALTFLYF
jgi:hypothetical protein